MPGINEILNWNFNQVVFKKSANNVISEETEAIIGLSQKALKELSERLPAGSSLPEQKLVADVYWQFQHYKDREKHELYNAFSKRDVRVLVWALAYQDNGIDNTIMLSNDFSIAIGILEEHWKDSFIISLWHILVQNWRVLGRFKPQKKRFLALMAEKCGQFDSPRSDIHNINEHMYIFLKPNSPGAYVDEILSQKMLLSESNKIIKQKESVLKYEYFSLIAEEYISRIGNHVFNEKHVIGVYEFLETHNSATTTIITCSMIINTGVFKDYQENVKVSTVKMVGDPIKKHLWRAANLDQYQISSIEKARLSLNRMLNREFINIFFEKLVQDRRRKIYWLKFLDKIDDIVFVGSRYNYSRLERVEAIQPYLQSRFKITRQNQGTCALIIYSSNFVFVEFSDTGALYIYRNNRFDKFKRTLNHIGKMDDLKITPKESFACKVGGHNFGYTEHVTNVEGRITHSGNWENRVNIWMRNHYA